MKKLFSVVFISLTSFLTCHAAEIVPSASFTIKSLDESSLKKTSGKENIFSIKPMGLRPIMMLSINAKKLKSQFFA